MILFLLQGKAEGRERKGLLVRSLRKAGVHPGELRSPLLNNQRLLSISQVLLHLLRIQILNPVHLTKQ